MWLRTIRRLLSIKSDQSVSKRRSMGVQAPFHLGFESLEDRLVPSNFVTLHQFAGPTSDGGTPDSGLIIDSNGDLFGTTQSGGNVVGGGVGGDGTVFELTPSNGGYILNILYAFTGGTAGQTPFSSLLMDSHGDLFGTTLGGGDANSDGTVFEMTPGSSGYTYSTVYTFTGGNGGQSPSTALIMDNSGDLFGTTGHGSDSFGTVFELTPGSSGYTFNSLHVFTGGTDGDNPGNVVLYNGNLFGTTGMGGSNNDGTVFELTPGSNGYTFNTIYDFTDGNDGSYPSADLTMDSSGDIFDTAYGGGSGQLGTIVELTPGSNGYTLNTLYKFTGGDDGLAPIGGVILDGNGNLFGTTSGGITANHTDGTVFELTAGDDGYTLTTLHTFTGDDGEAPVGNLVLDNQGDLFGDTVEGGTDGEGTVFELTTTPTLTSISPNGGALAGGTDVTISGTGLADASAVDFGSIPGTIVSDTPTQIVVETKAEAAGTVDVTVTTQSGTSNTSDNDKFTFFHGAPSFSDLSSPTIHYGANSVAITGTLSSNVNGQKVPSGESVQVTLNGVTQNAALDSNDNFSTTFDSSTLSASSTPYTIYFSYPGDAGFASTSDSSTLTVSQATPSFSDLSSPIIAYGQATTISGTLDANAGGSNVPAGEAVKVTLNGVTQNAILDSNDNFSTPFNTGAIGASATPYNIGFSYTGDDNFASATDSSTLTVNEATPSFSGLSAPTIIFGTASTTISGTLNVNAGSQPVPSGETVQVTLNGVTQNPTLESNDTFSTAFNTSTLAVSANPYTIGFSYSSDGNFNSATGNSSITVVSGTVDPANSLMATTLSSIQLGGVTAITLQARDAFGNDLTTGGLKVVLALENKTGAKGTFSAVKDNKNGTYSATFTSTLDGANVIAATFNGTAVASTQPITVSGGAVSLAESTVTSAETQITAGTTDVVALQADYPKDNPEPAGGLTVSFKLGSTTGGQGTFSAVTYQGNGQYTAIFTGTLAGKNSIKGYIDGLAVTTVAPSVAVDIGQLSLATTPVLLSSSSMKAGSTITVTLQPEDAGGNKLNLGENQTVVFSLESGQGTFGQVTPHANGTYTATFTTTTEGNCAITAKINGQPLTSTAPILAAIPTTVSLANSLVNATPGSVQSGSAVTVTLQAVDIYGNPEAGNLVVGFKLKGGSGQGTFGKVTYAGNGVYQALFTGTIAGTNTIESTVGGASVASTAAIAVTPGPYSLAHSIVTVSPSANVAVANTISITLQTKDAAGNDLTTDLLLEGVSISFELSNGSGGGQGLFSPVVYLGNGEYKVSFFATSVGSNTVLALIGGSKLTSKAPAIVVT
jgi:hypothetical protein